MASGEASQGWSIRSRLLENARYCRTVAPLYARQGKMTDAERWRMFAEDFEQAEARIREGEAAVLDASPLTFEEVARTSAARTLEASGFPVTDLPVEWWTNAMAGEAGEACNVAKKMSRLRLGIGGRWNKDADQQIDALRERLKREIGDVIIYAGLLATREGLAFADCVTASFNEKSDEIGSPLKLREGAVPLDASPFQRRVQAVIADMRRAVEGIGRSAMSPDRTTDEAGLINAAGAEIRRYADWLDAELKAESVSRDAGLSPPQGHATSREEE